MAVAVIFVILARTLRFKMTWLLVQSAVPPAESMVKVGGVNSFPAVASLILNEPFVVIYRRPASAVLYDLLFLTWAPNMTTG